MQKEYNKIILITAPSGSGKTSIVKYLMSKIPDLAFSISATTRLKRDSEKDGVDYHFISEEDFKDKIHEKEFLEWEMVYEGKYYGTLKSEMSRIWQNHKIPVLDIDVQGAIHVMSQYPINTMALFIQAPTLEDLKLRLQKRGSETEESLRARLNKSSFELTFKKHFKNIIVNKDFDVASREAEEIIIDFLKK
jgi:guanylate kinase